MARTATTMGKTHDGKWELLSSPSDSLVQQNKDFRNLRKTKSHARFALVQYQESDQPAMFITLRSIDAQKAHDERRATELAKANEAGKAETEDREKKLREVDAQRAKEHGAEIDRLNQLHPDEDKRRKFIAEAAARKAAEKALGESPGGPPPINKETLLKDGPSLEQWIEAGYNPGAYPPSGYERRESDLLSLYEANLENKTFDIKAELKKIQAAKTEAEKGKTAGEQNEEAEDASSEPQPPSAPAEPVPEPVPVAAPEANAAPAAPVAGTAVPVSSETESKPKPEGGSQKPSETKTSVKSKNK